MKKFLPYLFMGALCLIWPSWTNGQTYTITNSALNVGNPGGLRTASDASSTGGTNIQAYNNGTSTTNVWSAPYALPFAFDFYGSAVTHLMVSKNGLLTFDTTNTGLTVSAALDTNASLPNANVPNNTIAYFWDDFATSALGSNDNVWAIVEGTAPNRQLVILNFSYRLSTSSFNYFMTILEETSNKIYVVDGSYAASSAAISATVGIQIDGTTAYQVTTPLNGVSGSPNIQFGSGGSSTTDNEYYEFGFLAAGACVPPTALGASAITSSGATLGWTFGTGSSSVVEYGPTGFTQGLGTTMNAPGSSLVLASLSANTTYDFYVKDSCLTNSSTWVGPVTFTTACASTMSGTYTINGASPTAGTNFNSFSDAAAELNACGISGPVTINVVEGTYSERVIFDDITGASAVNTVVIQADASNTLPAEITSAATLAADNYVVQFNNSSWVTLDGITVSGTGATYSTAVEFMGANSNITIENCILNSNTVTTTSTNHAVVYDNTAVANKSDSISIIGNDINNGSYGIYLYGVSTTNLETGHVVSDNIIQNFYNYGMRLYYQDGAMISGNEITSGTVYSTVYGIYNGYSDNSTVKENIIKVYGTSTNYGIYNYYNDASAIAPNLIANNMISCIGNTGTTYGIYPFNNYYTDIVYNSINVTGGSATAGRGMYLNSSTTGTYGNVNVQNNNVVNSGSGYAFEVSSGAVTLGYVTSSDYNNIYATGATVARVNNSNYADLAGYQAAVMTMDQNSVSVDPLYYSPTDLHALSAGIDGMASAFSGVTTDIDGDPRAISPDIGADEFTPPTCTPSSGFVANPIYADSATVSWVAGPGATFNLEYGPIGFARGAGTLVTGIVDTFYSITTLAPATNYDFYVQDDCGLGDTSIWAGPGMFATACATFMAPRTESFDVTTTPLCWSQSSTSGGPWLFSGSNNSVNCPAATDHTGNAGSYAWMDQSGGDAGVILEMNDIDVSLLTTPALEFYYWMCGTGYTPVNATIVETWDGLNWNILDSIDVATMGWQRMFYDLTGHTYGANLVRIRFRAESGGSGSDFYGDNALDDITVDEYNVLLCAAPQVAPYTETFDGSSTPACWSQSTTSGGPWLFSGSNNSVNCPPAADHTGNAGSYAWMDQSGGDAGVILQMPVVDVSALTVPYLDIYYWMCAVGYTPPNKLYIETYDGLTWSVFDSIVQGTNGWENFGFDLTTEVYNTNLVQVRFRAESGGSGSDFYGDNTLDDVSIIEAPSCFLPSALGAYNLGTTTADIYWTTGGATNWNIEYGIAGFTPGTGTMMMVTNDTLSLASLSASSVYSFYVQDSCGVGDVSAWAGPFSFNTLCGVIVPPSLETFNNGFPANCWDYADGGTPLTGPTTLSAGAWGDDGFGNVGTSGSPRINLYNTGDEDWILSPFYDLTGGSFNAEFDFGVFLYANTGVGTLGSDDEVHFLVSLDTGSTWTSLAIFDSSYVTAVGGNHEVVSLSAYSGNVVMFAFWATEGLVDDPEDNDIFVDNFEVKAGTVVSGPCTVTNGLGNDTLCAPGITNYYSMMSNDVIYMDGNGVVLAAIDTLSFSISADSTLTQVAEGTAGAKVGRVGPLATLGGVTGFGNFSNGEYITVMDTIRIDSVTVRANGVIQAQMIVLDDAGGNLLQAGELFTTGAAADAIYQVEAGLVLTPGNYFIGMAYGAGTGQLYRATTGAVYPYTLAGKMSVDSVNFSGARYYYCYDMVISDYCISPDKSVTSTIIGQNAGDDGMFVACDNDPTMDLSTMLSANATTGGTFSSTNAGGALSGSMFNVGTAGSGVYSFTYLTLSTPSCPPDTSMMTVVVQNCTGCTNLTAPTAMVNDTICGPGFVTVSATGTNVMWYNPSDSILVGGNSFTDSIGSNTTYNAVTVHSGGPGVTIGASITSANAYPTANFTNGQYVTVSETVRIDSATFGVNGALDFVVMVQDIGKTALLQQSDLISFTGADTSAKEVGIVLTPGSYFLSTGIVGGTGVLWRMTGGASFPYGIDNYFVVDSSDFGPTRYYYLHDMVISASCFSTVSAAMGVIDSAFNAGTSNVLDTVCDTLASIDLSSYLGTHDSGGSWIDVDATGALTGGMFDATAVANGTTYTFRYTGGSGSCADTATLMIHVKDCFIGIKEYQETGIEVYPNPTKDVVFVESINKNAQDLTVELYNLTGQLVYSKTFDGNEKAQVSLGLLPDGVYSIKVITDDATSVHRITKQ